MKTRQIIILAIISIFATSSAQVENENTLRWFRGGTVSTDFSFRTDLFCGIGSTGQFGWSASNSDASSLFWNPAALAFKTNRQVMVTLLPPLSLYIANWYDIPGEIQSTIDDAIADYRLEDTEVIYPTVTPVLYHRGGINTGVITIPIHKWVNQTVIGFGYSRALELQFNLIGNGLSSLLETRKEVGTQTMVVKFRNHIDMNVNMSSTINRFSFAAARKWAPQFSAGFTLDRYFGDAFFDGVFMIDGIMETAGSEFAFNDPYDPHINFEDGEQNNLNQSIYCSFRGKGWGLKIGGNYKLNPALSFGAMIEFAPTITFSGIMEVDQNIIPALNSDALFGDSEEEIMDPARLDLAKLTLTVPYENPTDDKLTLRFPSSMNFNMSYQWGFLRGGINWTKYFGEFSYDFLGTSRGAKFKWGLKKGFDLKYIQIGLGMLVLDEIRKGSDNDEDASHNILIPQFSMGTGFSLNRFTRTETLAFLAPTPVFKQVLFFSF